MLSSSSMPSITGGLNGAPAGRFLDVSGWVGVSERIITNRLGFNKNSLNPACGGREEESNPVGVRAQFETPLPQSLPQSSGVTGSRPTLALVDAAPDFHKSGPMPSQRPISWGSARNRRARMGREAVEVVGVVSLGTLPAGTTEAQVDD